MLPIGESAPRTVDDRAARDLDDLDAEFIRAFIRNVVPFSEPGVTGEFSTMSIKGTRKTTKQPAYSHSARSISLGQDSLSSIATALASFKKLQRNWPEYRGGILVIDEIDAGFHPRAQQRLVAEMRSAAKKLRLQVIATSHSMPLIESVHPDSYPEEAQHPDGVVYLADTKKPGLLPDQSLAAIRADMSGRAPAPLIVPPRPTLKIYLDDEEAFDVLTKLLSPKVRAAIRKVADVNLKPLPLSVGYDNLAKFPKKDPYFRTVVIVLDSDVAASSSLPSNAAVLPGDGERPENTIFNFVKNLVDGLHPESSERLFERSVTNDQLYEHLLDGVDKLQNRETAKRWFRKRWAHLENWEIVEEWALAHPEKVEEFQDSLVSAANAAVSAQREVDDGLFK